MNAIVLHRRQGHLIDPGRATIGSDPLPRLPQDVTPVDAVIQGVEAATLRLLGRSPEPVLELSHFGRRQMLPLGVVGRGGPRHALALTAIPDVTEVGTLPWCSGSLRPPRYYDPVGLPLTSVGLHHWLIPTVFADEAGQTGLSCPDPNRACVPIHVPRGDPTKGISGTGQEVGHGPSP